MKRVKIFGMIKDKGLLMLKIKKSEYSLKVIRNFLVEVGFPRGKANQIFSKLGGPDNNYSARKYTNSLYQDLFFRITYSKAYAIIVFGKNRSFVTIHKDNIEKVSSDKIDNFFLF